MSSDKGNVIYYSITNINVTKIDELLEIIKSQGISLDNLATAKNEEHRKTKEEKLNAWKLENNYLDETQLKTKMDELLDTNTDNFNFKQLKGWAKNIQTYRNYENSNIPEDLKIKATATKKLRRGRAVGPAEQFRAKCEDLVKYPIGSPLMFKCPNCPKTYFSDAKLKNHIQKEDTIQDAKNKPLHSSKTFQYAADTIENRKKWARS